MKLATFVAQGKERFGFVLTVPATGEDRVFEPAEVAWRLQRYCQKMTSPYWPYTPHFLENRPWPRDLTAFLSLGDEGMSALRRMRDFLQLFLEQSDHALLAGAGFPLCKVKLRAPIPRPRLYFGLVQNSPSRWRNDDSRPILNVYPVGHQRPQGTVIGPGDTVCVTPEAGGFGWFPELGAIIGRGGRHIEVSRAREHIAGLTVTLDASISDGYRLLFRKEGGDSSAPLDFLSAATASWLSKKSDTMGAMGPFLTTLDEIGNIYDLLMYARQSGRLRDRTYTGAMHIGIERLISFLSSFMTLYPGDVVHMGTMGIDGVPMTDDMLFGPEDYIEGEIERVGTLRVRVVKVDQEDWRSPDDVGRTVHPAPAVRDLIESGATVIERPDAWSVDKVRHFWTVFENYLSASTAGSLAHPRLPRVLNCPARALGISGHETHIPRRARGLSLGPELAFVVSQVAHRVPEEEADSYVLGYLAMCALRDDSFAEFIREPATVQERDMPRVYARWADGFNIVSSPPVPLSITEVRGRRMYLSVDEIGEVEGNTDEYVALAPAVLAFLTQHITLFPGDVVTLGRIGNQLTVPAGQRLPPGTTLHGLIEGVGEVHSSLLDDRERKKSIASPL